MVCKGCATQLMTRNIDTFRASSRSRCGKFCLLCHWLRLIPPDCRSFVWFSVDNPIWLLANPIVVVSYAFFEFVSRTDTLRLGIVGSLLCSICRHCMSDIFALRQLLSADLFTNATVQYLWMEFAIIYSVMPANFRNVQEWVCVETYLYLLPASQTNARALRICAAFRHLKHPMRIPREGTVPCRK